MSETSGFFDAELIEVPGGTDYWDREYLALQFAKYFSMFIGNGVYGGTPNALKIAATGNGLEISMEPGYAMINGFWYYNDTIKYDTLTPNATASSRVDSVMISYDPSTRSITSIRAVGRTEVVRSGEYELRLARVTVGVGATTLTNAVVTDDRADNSVCGFVTGLIDVVQTSDLFSQFTAMFNEWFQDMKDQLTTDAAGHLQAQIDLINANVASEYDPEQSYFFPSYVLHEGILYSKIDTGTSLPTTGPFNPSKWEQYDLEMYMLSARESVNTLIETIAQEFYQGSEYVQGSYVWHNGILHLCKSFVSSSSEFVEDQWKQTRLDVELMSIVRSIAPLHIPTKLYKAGALVIYNNRLYVCTSASPVSGNFVLANWTQKSIYDLIAPATEGAKKVLKTSILANDVFTAETDGVLQVKCTFTVANTGYIVMRHSNGQTYQLNAPGAAGYGATMQIPMNYGQYLTVAAAGSIGSVEVAFFPKLYRMLT